MKIQTFHEIPKQFNLFLCPDKITYLGSSCAGCMEYGKNKQFDNPDLVLRYNNCNFHKVVKS
jgi:hypothetical protein